MDLVIDLKNAVEDPRIDNFTCLLFRLMFKADCENLSKLGRSYPVEMLMIKSYKTNCPYKNNEVDYEEIYRQAVAQHSVLTSSGVCKEKF